jgi:hypothetical protein
MLVLFEVFLAPGPGVDPILSDEVVELTQAQVMTPEQAEAVGFSGLPDDPAGRKRLFIAVAPKDSRLIHTRLEASHLVSAFRIHDVNV